MKNFLKKAGHYLLLVVVTAFATGVMWWVSSKNTGRDLLSKADITAPAAVARERAPVAVQRIEPKVCELTIRYAGKLRPWESFSLGFDVGGRLASLGQSEAGEPLDDGDTVRAGQVLARLDDRVLRARRAEAVAQLEMATSDYNRDTRLYERGGQAITDAEYQQTLTNLALRKAQLEVANKNLEDTVLTAPVDGRVSRRMVEAGESVAAHTMVFDVMQTEDVLLVVNVPESRVRELQLRQRRVERARGRSQGGSPEDRVFRARVYLEGRNAFGDPWPPIDAEVYRIAQMADEATGLFEVEVRIPNQAGLLRPGMVASAEIVYDRLLAYEVPDTSVIFRGDEVYLFAVEPATEAMQVMFWPAGEAPLTKAKRLDLERWVDQGEHVVLPVSNFQAGLIVARGHRRLADGDLVRVVNPEVMRGADLARKPLATSTARKASISDER